MTPTPMLWMLGCSSLAIERATDITSAMTALAVGRDPAPGPTNNSPHPGRIDHDGIENTIHLSNGLGLGD